MSIDKTILRETLAQYQAWNEGKFVEAVLTAGQKTPQEKWREYQEWYSIVHAFKPEPSYWEQLRTMQDWEAYYDSIHRFEEWRKEHPRTPTAVT